MLSLWCCETTLKRFLVVTRSNNQSMRLAIILDHCCLHHPPCPLCHLACLFFLNHTWRNTEFQLTNYSMNKYPCWKWVCFHCQANTHEQITHFTIVNNMRKPLKHIQKLTMHNAWDIFLLTSTSLALACSKSKSKKCTHGQQSNQFVIHHLAV